jgi:hypothetical protein
MAQSNIEVVKSLHQAFNRRDTQTFLAFTDRAQALEAAELQKRR